MKGSLHRRRRAIALMTCVLWLLGVEVLPGLHLAFHHGDHTHAADGTMVAEAHDADDDHDHDHDHVDADHDDHDDHDHDDGDHDDSLPAIDHPEHAHQAGGISHHAAALHRPPPPPLSPVAAERIVWRISAPAASAPRSAALARPTSRGPPAV